jgi:hypothetical protein
MGIRVKTVLPLPMDVLTDWKHDSMALLGGDSHKTYFIDELSLSWIT